MDCAPITKGMAELCSTEILLHRLFEKQVAAENSDKTAIIFDTCGDISKSEQQISYRALNIKANKYASTILNLIPPSDRISRKYDFIIGVCMDHSINMMATILGIWKAGAAYMPIEKNSPIDRLSFTVTEAKPMLVIYDDDYEKHALRFGETPKISFEKLESASKAEPIENIPTERTFTLGESDLAMVCYTSGSTGYPRGAKLTHSNFYNRLDWQWETFPYSKTEKYTIFKTPFSFLDSMAEMWAPLLKGIVLVIIPSVAVKNPEVFVSVLTKYKIERLTLVPSLLQNVLLYLIHLNDKDLLPHLKRFICSGESLTPGLAKMFFDYFKDGKHELCNFYGATEFTADGTYYQISNWEQIAPYSSVPIGRPIKNTRIYILDEEMKQVKEGQIGELYVAGKSVCLGYVNGRNSDRYMVNPFSQDECYNRLCHSGDYASYKGDVIFYEGRNDTQFKVRGNKVDLLEIENVVEKFPFVQKVTTLCYLPRQIDQTIVSFVILKDEYRGRKTAKHIEEYSKTKLMEYMKPEFMIVDSFPQTISGKLDRQGLLEMFGNWKREMNIVFDFTDVPSNRMEAARILFEVIAKEIGYSNPTKISLTSNFYELGGTSINSMSTLVELKKRGYSISIASFIASKDLGVILERICTSMEPCIINVESIGDHLKKETSIEFHSENLDEERKKEIIQIVTDTFYCRCHLVKFMRPHMTRESYIEVVRALCEDAIKRDLSFVVKDTNEKIVGVTLNFDLRDEPPVIASKGFGKAMEFFNFVEKSVSLLHHRDELPAGKNEVVHSFLLSAATGMSPQENVALVLFIESETIRRARARKFNYILTTNTAPITQLICLELGYRTLNDVALNEFIRHDGIKPYGDAPDTMRAIVSVKNLNEH